MAAFNPTYYAHSLAGKPESEWQTLDDHLVRVAEQCGAFAAVFGYRTWGYAIGLLHDVGKASDAFQRRLRHATAVVDHSTLGASIARALYSRSTQRGFPGALMAYAIAGHHGGMPNGIAQSVGSHRRPLESRLAELDSDASTAPTRAAIDALFSTGVLTAPHPESLELLRPLEHPTRGNAQSAKVANQLNALSLNTTARMLYSCLVDADYLDTERVMAPDEQALRAETRTSSLHELLAMLEEHLHKLAASPESDTPVNAARRQLAADCRNAAAAEPGLFTLTAPTGSGKTKSVVLFGLMHAIRHGMQRIVFALPFTTLVEQTADVLRGIFGADNVLEHHSNYDFEAAEDKGRLRERLAVQNWDAPIVVTTNVQLFESLFANTPSKCRKVHNIANSVVVLDEAQTIPDGVLSASLAMIEELCIDFGASVVLSTATQPALEHIWPFGSKPHEIVRHRDEIESAFANRVDYVMRGSLPLQQLVSELASGEQCLCVVGTTAKAREVYTELATKLRASGEMTPDELPSESSLYHLSANMTPEHRSLLIEHIKARLNKGDVCRVVSTQLIEAGVDVDFGIVYRELAGIDSLIQASGRCNREGRAQNPGKVHVFEIEEHATRDARATRTWLGKMRELARKHLVRSSGRIDNDTAEAFFTERYADTNLDVKGVYREVTNASAISSRATNIDFETIANDYKIIDDRAMPVFVPYGSRGLALYDELQTGTSHGIPPAAFASKLQRSSVSVAPYLLDELRRCGCIDEVTYAPLIIMQPSDGSRRYYSDEWGLAPPDEAPQDLLFV